MAALAVTPEALFSMSTLRRAWQWVRRSGSMAGTDGVTPGQFGAALEAELNRLRQTLLNGTYQPRPVRRFYLKKASGKLRPISVWTVRDRVAQRVIHDALTPVFEAFFLPCSYGFRPGRSTEDAIRAIVQARDSGLTWLLDADIADCFGSIRLDLLGGQIERAVEMPLIRRLLDLWLHTPVVGTQGEIAGVSQGGVISPLLANLYLHRFDEMLRAALPRAELVRFADDFVVLSLNEDMAVWSMEVARRGLENLALRLNLRKTRIITFDEGFTFLGVEFKGQSHRPVHERKESQDE
ncbi:MAG: RNA-directed DNA polymerase [Anaerolinea sp.]|nr:RNA-directed DNA polymerase [Anaerolinea sp.]